jgi:tetratricopeptide (TPR) repeat protein
MDQHEEAVESYFRYMERCDRGEFPPDFREDAEKYMAISFAEFDKPIDRARKFFSSKGGRKYERDVYYGIAKACRENDKNREAVDALDFMLKTYPDYGRAPDIQRMLIETQVVMRDFEGANESRERMIDTYGPGSKWWRKNESDPNALADARKVLERELSLIPVYYHERAAREKSKNYYEKAVKRYKQYIETFPEEKWTVWEYTFYLAECHNELKQYEDAAKCYDFVASAQPSSFGKRKGRATDDTTKKNV